LLGANVVARNSWISAKSRGLASIVETPHLWILRIVWCNQRSPNEVRLGIDDVGQSSQCFDGVAGVGRVNFRDTQTRHNLEGRADCSNRQRNLTARFLHYDLTAGLLLLRARTKTNENLAGRRVEISFLGSLSVLRYSPWRVLTIGHL